MEDTTLRAEISAAEAEIAQRRPEQALARCQDLQERFPRALVVQRLLGETYLALHKPREALGALERALDGDPEDARACCARALIHQIHGDSTAALAWYGRACEIRPEDATLRDAYRELAESLGAPPYRPSTVGLARLYMRGDLFVHAEREWETILAQQPDRLDAQVGLAETLWRAGKAERAGEVARRVVGNIHSCVKALLIVAALEHAAGRTGEAKQLLQRAAELDPERRIGRALYADRFAAGDAALEALLMAGPEAGAAGAPGVAVERAPATGAPSVALADTPTTHMSSIGGSSQPAAPGAGVSAGPGTPASGLPAAAQADLRAVSAFAQSRVTAIPRDFHQIFAETEFMIWGQEEEAARGGSAASHPGSAALASAPSASPSTPDADDLPPFERSRTDRFERSTVIVPPALAGTEGGMDDTDARAAIGWVRWLQAQGARPIEGAGRSAAARSAAAPGGTGPLRLPAGGTGPLRPTDPLASPARESLRQMFAELDPSAAAPPPAAANPQPPSASDGAALAASQAGAADQHAGTGAAPPAPLWPADDGSTASRRSEGPGPSVTRGGRAGKLRSPEQVFTFSDMGTDEPPEDIADTTTEAHIAIDNRADDGSHRETDVPADGYWRDTPAPLVEHDPEPEPEVPSYQASVGETAAPETTEPDAPRDEPSLFDPLAVGALEPPSELPSGPPIERRTSDGSDSPAGEEYLGRLRQARKKRGEGRAEEALTEYRAILHNSPDTLDDLVHDLRDMAAETNSPEVHRLLGDAYIREGDYVRALESYNRALALTQEQGT